MAKCACLHYGAGDPAVQVYGLGAGAMRYQQRGYAVLPLTRGQKRPHAMLGDQGGVHWATLHPLYAMNWWEQDPAANVGVATGAASQLVVIDLDVKNGQDGYTELRKFLIEGSAVAVLDLWIPETAVVQTPSGGYHIWLRTQPGATVPERPSILPGVDVKGNGGLVVAPPSMQLRFPLVREGERSRGEPVPVPYRWVAGCPCVVPAAPPWLLPWLASAPAPQHAGGPAPGTGPGLGDLASTGIPVGQRNRDLYRYACARYRIHGTGSSAAATVLADCEQVLSKTDQRDFGRGEVLRILESARRFVAAQQESEAAAVAGWRRAWARTRTPGTG